MDLGIALGIAGVTLSVLALLLAISPFAQMIWGRPKLRFDFVEFTGADGKNLICAVHNDPIKSRLLKLARVTRDAGEVSASVGIVEQGTNKALTMSVPMNINDAVSRTMGLVVNCRPHFSVAFPVIHCTEDGPIAFDVRHNEVTPIPAGLYIALINIVCGERSYVLQRPMNIHQDPTRTFWV